MITIGTRVTDRYGTVGKVARLHDDFTAAASLFVSLSARQWLDAQEIPFTAEQQAEMWATLVHDKGKGAWLSPLSLLKPIRTDGER